MLARFMDTSSVRDNQVLQSALANAACYLIGAMEDLNAAVAQKAIHDLETIKESSILVRMFTC